jgi:hypothetical protein
MRAFIIVAVATVVTVAVTLTAQTNTRSIVQDRSVCLPYEPSGLTLDAVENGAWRLLRDDGAIFRLFDNREDADAGLAIAKEHTQLCYIGKSNSRPNRAAYIMEYWK